MLRYLPVWLVLLYSCQNTAHPPEQNIPQPAEPKGELAFLLQYKGQMPSEVGFLTNHVVERRLANLMKDSFVSFMRNTQYDRPLTGEMDHQMVGAMFYQDSDRTYLSAAVYIDVKQDAIWAEYYSGDSLIEFTDHPSLPKPGIWED